MEVVFLLVPSVLVIFVVLKVSRRWIPNPSKSLSRALVRAAILSILTTGIAFGLNAIGWDGGGTLVLFACAPCLMLMATSDETSRWVVLIPVAINAVLWMLVAFLGHLIIRFRNSLRSQRSQADSSTDR